MVTAPTPVEIFCSYAREDEVWLRKLETHLSLLKRQSLISLWYDRLITPGTDWAKSVDAHLETASVILLLVSADFFASDYCYGIEMKRALARQEAGEARVVPILVHPVNWKDAPLAHLQALPTDAKPLSTWRDKDAALADVVASIRRVLEDLPLLAASAPRAALPNIWHVPYRRNPFFTGQEKLLGSLHEHLAVKAVALTQRPQAISGLGGIGKTQIALEYACRYRNSYRFVFWMRSATRGALTSDFVTIANLLQLPEKNEQDQNLVLLAVKKWLVTQSGWLLIFDNADDVTMVSEFVPTDSKGHIVLTSRAQAFGALAQPITVEKMELAEGTLFLLRRAKILAEDAILDQASHEQLAGAKAIVIEMDFLPLALDQAGAYIDETGCGLSAYLDLYRTHRKELLQRRGRLPEDHPEPVATTWSLSFQKVEQANAAAVDLLYLCAFLEPDTIPEELISEGSAHLGSILQSVAVDTLKLNDVFEELRKFSLIQRNRDTKILSIHRLVQAVLKDTIEEEIQRQWAERAVHVINAVFPDGVGIFTVKVEEVETWPRCRKYLPQVQSCAVLIQSYTLAFEEAADLLHRTARYLWIHALYELAESFYQQALHIWEQVHGPQHHDVATFLINLANVYKEQGKYAEAEPLYQRALHIWEQIFGPEYPQMASLFDNLANLYSAQRKYVEAEPLYQRALHIWEQTFGPNHAHVAYPLNNLANLYCQQGKYTEAEPLYQRALHIWEETLGSEHPQVGHPLQGLANLYSAQGKYAEVKPLYQRVLHIWEQVLEPEHPHTQMAQRNYASLLHQIERDTEATPPLKISDERL